MQQIRHEDSLQEKERRFLDRVSQAESKLKAKGLRFVRVQENRSEPSTPSES
jgi:hypothetical protein